MFLDILDGKRKIDFETFNMLRNSYLDMNIHDIFREPDLSNSETRKYWMEQTMRNPMLFSAEKNPHISRLELEKKVLLVYLEKIAISECYQIDRENAVALAS